MKKILSRVLFELLLLLLPMAAMWFGFFSGFSEPLTLSSPAFDFSAEALAYHAPGCFFAYFISRAIAVPLRLEKHAWWSILSYGAVLFVIFVSELFSVASALAV